MLVVTGPSTRVRVPSETRRGEDPLPQPIAARRWILPAQGIREQNLSATLLQVAPVETANLHQVALEGPAEASREGRHPVAPVRSNSHAVQELRRIADGGRFGGHRGGSRDRSREENRSLRLAAQAGKTHGVGRAGHGVCRSRIAWQIGLRSMSPGPGEKAGYCGSSGESFARVWMLARSRPGIVPVTV